MGAEVGGRAATASATAYACIRALIFDGVVQPGERLKEQELTDRCGVSRTPVREALRRLAAEGLVIMNPRQGAEVVSVDPAALEEVYTLRTMVERHAAERAATRISEVQLASLKQLMFEMREAIKAGREAIETRFTSANGRFHQVILEAAQSPRLLGMAALVVQPALTLRTVVRYSEVDRARSMRHHDELISAFEARSPEWAASVMESHVRSAYFALVRDPSGAQLAVENGALSTSKERNRSAAARPRRLAAAQTVPQ